mmetsp:Transcript_7301/g.8528  ORF Transcript_7301/g.8528 Transcript_7301/m.8528 type:complete len:120 (-) Transcript_7301:7-366(-)
MNLLNCAGKFNALSVDRLLRLHPENIDPRDHSFIVGASNPSVKESLQATVDAAVRRGASPQEIAKLETDWVMNAQLTTFPDLVSSKLKSMGKSVADWEEKSMFMGIDEMRAEAKRYEQL